MSHAGDKRPRDPTDDSSNDQADKQANNQSDNLSNSQSVNPSTDPSNNQPNNPLQNQAINQSNNPSTDETNDKTAVARFGRLISLLSSPSIINASINQPTNQPINHTTNPTSIQTTNQTIGPSHIQPTSQPINPFYSPSNNQSVTPTHHSSVINSPVISPSNNHPFYQSNNYPSINPSISPSTNPPFNLFYSPSNSRNLTPTHQLANQLTLLTTSPPSNQDVDQSPSLQHIQGNQPIVPSINQSVNPISQTINQSITSSPEEIDQSINLSDLDGRFAEIHRREAQLRIKESKLARDLEQFKQSSSQSHQTNLLNAMRQREYEMLASFEQREQELFKREQMVTQREEDLSTHESNNLAAYELQKSEIARAQNKLSGREVIVRNLENAVAYREACALKRELELNTKQSELTKRETEMSRSINQSNNISNELSNQDKSINQDQSINDVLSTELELINVSHIQSKLYVQSIKPSFNSIYDLPPECVTLDTKLTESLNKLSRMCNLKYCTVPLSANHQINRAINQTIDMTGEYDPPFKQGEKVHVFDYDSKWKNGVIVCIMFTDRVIQSMKQNESFSLSIKHSRNYPVPGVKITLPLYDCPSQLLEYQDYCYAVSYPNENGIYLAYCYAEPAIRRGWNKQSSDKSKEQPEQWDLLVGRPSERVALGDKPSVYASRGAVWPPSREGATCHTKGHNHWTPQSNDQSMDDDEVLDSGPPPLERVDDLDVSSSSVPSINQSTSPSNATSISNSASPVSSPSIDQSIQSIKPISQPAGQLADADILETQFLDSWVASYRSMIDQQTEHVRSISPNFVISDAPAANLTVTDIHQKYFNHVANKHPSIDLNNQLIKSPLKQWEQVRILSKGYWCNGVIVAVSKVNCLMWAMQDDVKFSRKLIDEKMFPIHGLLLPLNLFSSVLQLPVWQKYCYAVAITRSSGSDPEWYVEPAIRRGWLPSCPYREEKHIVRVIEGEPPSERLLSEHRARPLEPGEVMWPPNIRESEEEWETQVKDADVICID